jgi:hypothetical protein
VQSDGRGQTSANGKRIVFLSELAESLADGFSGPRNVRLTSG